MLAEMGSTIQINNDGINDDSPTGNFWTNQSYKFAVRLFPGQVKNYITDRVEFVDYYSGSSLEKVGNLPLVDSDADKVTILAKGNATTYQTTVKDGYNVYDTVSDDQGGDAIPAIASQEIGTGRVIVSGMNFINDKQLDESYNTKGNDELALNSINWLAGRETKVSTIEAARKLADGTPITVEGTVTTAAGSFYDAFYIQDETGGIMAFNEVPEGSLKLGDKVRIYGHVKTFENNKELEFGAFKQDVIKIGSSDPISPKVVSTQEANSDSNQGLLVKVTGKVVSKYDDNSYIINDGSGNILVFTDGYIANQTGAVPSLKVGDTLEAVGVTGEFANGKRIRVRDTKELKKVASVKDTGGTTDPDPEPTTPPAPPADDKGTVKVDDTAVITVNGEKVLDEQKLVNWIKTSKEMKDLSD